MNVVRGFRGKKKTSIIQTDGLGMKAFSQTA